MGDGFRWMQGLDEQRHMMRVGIGLGGCGCYGRRREEAEGVMTEANHRCGQGSACQNER